MRKQKLKRLCQVPGCTLDYFATGLCRKHYDKRYSDLRKHGITHTLESLSKCVIKSPIQPADRKRAQYLTGWHPEPMPPLEGLNMDMDKAIGPGYSPVQAVPPGRIITEDDLRPAYTGDAPKASIEAKPGQDEGRKYSRKEVSRRREQLHKGITATLEILQTFYSELRELDGL